MANAQVNQKHAAKKKTLNSHAQNTKRMDMNVQRNAMIYLKMSQKLGKE